MKKLLTVVAINELTDGQNGNKRYNLIGGRGGVRCLVTLREGESLESLGVKIGCVVSYHDMPRVNKEGLDYTSPEFIGLFDVKSEAQNDYDFQMQLFKTRELAKAGMKTASADSISKALELAKDL